MKHLARTVLAIFLTTIFAGSSWGESEQSISWREQYAYSVGMAAYPYVLPYWYMSQLRWMWTTQRLAHEGRPYAPVNEFYHAPKLTDASYRDGGGPNNDTVYSAAWLHVDKEPIILSHPDMGERNFSFHLTGYTSDLIDVVSQRATGSAAGSFAIVPKGFNGELPVGVKQLKAVTTPWILLVGRTMVDGKRDMSNVAALQKKYTLIPLSRWGAGDVDYPEAEKVWAPYRAKQDPLASWRTINRAMTENPPPESERALQSFLAQVNIGPDQNLDDLDDDSKRGLARAAGDAHKMAIHARSDLPGGTKINGWRRSPDSTGRMGAAGLFFERGVMQSFKGISPNYPEEGRYFNRSISAEGVLMDASRDNYQLTFPAGQLPPVDAFWSITMYGLDANLVDNSLDRYSIGSRSTNLSYNSDGGLTLYLQHESPRSGKENNWLPAPNGNFYVSIRTYRPKKAIMDGSWAPENIVTVVKP